MSRLALQLPPESMVAGVPDVGDVSSAAVTMRPLDEEGHASGSGASGM
jgi:hypothetical protein